MKKLEFKTAKCEFDLLEGGQDYTLEYMKNNDVWKAIYLTHITEEEAREIVDLKGDRFQDYDHVSCCDRWCNTAIKSLHSLIKSRGVYLFENPIKNSKLGFIGNVSDIDVMLAQQKHTRRIEKEEQKTFYNPILFIKSK